MNEEIVKLIKFNSKLDFLVNYIFGNSLFEENASSNFGRVDIFYLKNLFIFEEIK